MARRLKTLAKEIRKLGFTVTLQESYSSTDRKIGRLRHPGKGRTGLRLTVRDKEGRVLLSHDSSQTYRCNSEVEQWLADHGGLKLAKSSATD